MTPERPVQLAPEKSELQRRLAMVLAAGGTAILLGFVVLLGDFAGPALPRLAVFSIFAILISAGALFWRGARLLKAEEAHRVYLENFHADQRSVLERIAAGAPLPGVLEQIVRLVEKQADGMVCSILLLDDQGRLRLGAAPGLPAEFSASIEGAAIGPDLGSCGAAAFRAERVIVEDIETDPLWAPFKHLALPHNLRACWSTPIFSPRRRVLGTFAMYYHEPSGPEPREIEWVDAATHLAAIAICRDQAAQALRDSEARYRQMVDTAYEGVWLLDKDARTTFANRRMGEMLGYTPEEMLGRTMFDFMDESAKAQAAKNFERRKAGVSEQHEFRFTRRDGSDLWSIVAASPLQDEGGEMTGALGLVTDITTRKRAEEERTQLETQLRQSQKLQSLGTLAGGIAHDFNNILTAISGNAQLAIDDLPRDHSAQLSLAEIEKASERAADLVRQILAFSRPQETKRENVSLPEIIREALRLLRASLPASVEIRTDFAADTPLVSADATQIHQVIMNLGTNAAQAMSGRGGLLALEVASFHADAALASTCPDLREGRYARLIVRDTGCGMEAAVLERIFEPFFTTKEQGKGTGLGLSVVHGIVQAHGGAITVHSAPGAGTTFQLYFPASVSVGEKSAATPLALPRAAGERVLYVDDEERLVLLARRGLERLGFGFTGFTDPVRALAAFRAAPGSFDLVVTDLTMPVLTGLDFAAEILRLRPELPVILTTGFLRPEDQDSARSLGIRHFLPKPSTLDEVGQALHGALNRDDTAALL